MSFETMISNSQLENFLETLRERLSDVQKNEFDKADSEAIKVALSQIQSNIGSRKIPQIGQFIKGMQKLEKVGKCFVENQKCTAFIWGPIYLELMAAATNMALLNALLVAYKNIGTVLDTLIEFNAILRATDEIEDVEIILETYFSNLFSFHLAIIELFVNEDRNSNLAFKAAWPRVETKLFESMENLKENKVLVEDLVKRITKIQTAQGSKTSHEAEEVQDIQRSGEDEGLHLSSNLNDKQSRQLANDDISPVPKSIHESILQKRAILKTKLNPPSYQRHHRSLLGKRYSNTAGDWILRSPQFELWFNEDQRSQSILYLCGNPGTGKTVLTARLIDHIQTKKQAIGEIVLFSYFDPSLRECGSYDGIKHILLRAILNQMVDQDVEILELVWERICAEPPASIHKEDFLEGLFNDCILHFSQSHAKIWIVLDGLDICQQTQADLQDILQWVTRTRDMNSDGKRLRILISARLDTLSRHVLSRSDTIFLESSPEHLEDVESFIKTEAKEIQYRLQFRRDEATKIRIAALKRSDETFIFAKILLGSVGSQDMVRALMGQIGTLTSGGISTLYERICSIVFDPRDDDRRFCALQIIGWTITAGRPLRWREIQTRFSIDLDTETCNPSRRLIDDCKAICGSLVDVGTLPQDSKADQIIEIVHDTATRYLVDSRRIGYLDEQIRFLTFCSQYLSSSPISGASIHNNIETIQELGLSGYYGFLDYCLAFWDSHAEIILRQSQSLKPELKAQVLKAVETLLSACDFEATNTSDISEKTDENLSLLRPEDGDETSIVPIEPPLALEASVETILSQLRDFRRRSAQGSKLEPKYTAIRRAIEQIDVEDLDPEAQVQFLECYGTKRYKCPYIRCLRFSEGFGLSEERDAHVWEHEGPYKCPEGGCLFSLLGFHFQVDLTAHIRKSHHSTTASSQRSARGMEPMYDRLVYETSSDPTENIDDKSHSFDSRKGTGVIAVHRVEIGTIRSEISGSPMTLTPYVTKGFDQWSGQEEICKKLPFRKFLPGASENSDFRSTRTGEQPLPDTAPLSTNIVSPTDTSLPTGDMLQSRSSSPISSGTGVVYRDESDRSDFESVHSDLESEEVVYQDLSDPLPILETDLSLFSNLRTQSRHASIFHDIVNSSKLWLENILGQRISFWPLEEPLEPCLPGYQRRFYDCECGIEMTWDLRLSDSLEASIENPVSSTSETLRNYVHILRIIEISFQTWIPVLSGVIGASFWFRILFRFASKTIDFIYPYINYIFSLADPQHDIGLERRENTSLPTRSHETSRTLLTGTHWMLSIRNTTESLLGHLKSLFNLKNLFPADGRTTLANESSSYELQRTRCNLDSYAFWCVRRDDLNEILKQIPIYNRTTNGEFFEILRMTYNEFRGIGRFFSVNYICSIQYVSFQLIEPVSDIGDGLCDNIYKALPYDNLQRSYTPPWSTTSHPYIPAGRREIMKHFHKVNKRSMERCFIGFKLPKKHDGKLEIRDAIGFGLQAVEGPSSFKVIMTVAAIFLIPTSIVVPYWLDKYPGDLQDAFTIPNYLAAC